MVELGLFAVGVNEPVFAHASRFILDEFFAPVTPHALRRNHFHHQIGCVGQAIGLHDVQPVAVDEEDIRLPSSFQVGELHVEGRRSKPAQFIRFHKKAQNGNQPTNNILMFVRCGHHLHNLPVHPFGVCVCVLLQKFFIVIFLAVCAAVGATIVWAISHTPGEGKYTIRIISSLGLPR